MNPAPAYGRAPRLFISARSNPRPELLRFALLAGVITGAIEGLLLFLFFGLGWGNEALTVGVSIDIVWISTYVALAVFLALGSVVALVGRLYPSIHAQRAAVALFLFLTFFDWVSAPRRITIIGEVSIALGLAAFAYRRFRAHELQSWRACRRASSWALALALLMFPATKLATWSREQMSLANLPAAPAGEKNVVFLIVDTLRADHLGNYGYPRSTSPEMDKLARGGVVFDNAISPSSWTLPSHASMMTGLLPYQNGADDGADHAAPLASQFPTLAEKMRQHGYVTAAFSGNSFYFCRRTGLSRGFIHFEDYFYSIEDIVSRTFWGREFSTYLRRRLGVREFPIRQHARQVNRRFFEWMDATSKRPFFVALNYFDLHDPYRPPQPYRSRFSREKNPGGLINDDDDAPRLTREQVQNEVDAYDGAVSYVDDQVRDLINGLQASGLTRDTLLVITSDHGELFDEHGLYKHRNALYRPLIHVPLIFWAPFFVPSGTRIPTPVSTTFLPATIMAMAGTGDSSLPGRRLDLLWTVPQARDSWPYPVSELTRDSSLPLNAPAHSGGLESITTAEWQLIKNEKSPMELYDWRLDPGELSNKGNSTTDRDILLSLDSILRATACGDVVRPACGAPLPDAQREMMPKIAHR